MINSLRQGNNAHSHWVLVHHLAFSRSLEEAPSRTRCGSKPPSPRWPFLIILCQLMKCENTESSPFSFDLIDCLSPALPARPALLRVLPPPCSPAFQASSARQRSES